MRIILTGCTLLPLVSSGSPGQPGPLQNASDFSSVEYYDPPNQMQISSRLSGAEATPQPNGLMLIKQFKLEMYGTNGTLQYVVEAPDCLYDQVNGTANSSGLLKVRQADGQVELAGQGFLWRQDDGYLTLSNQVNTTIIETATAMKLFP